MKRPEFPVKDIEEVVKVVLRESSQYDCENIYCQDATVAKMLLGADDIQMGEGILVIKKKGFRIELSTKESFVYIPGTTEKFTYFIKKISKVKKGIIYQRDGYVRNGSHFIA